MNIKNTQLNSYAILFDKIKKDELVYGVVVDFNIVKFLIGDNKSEDKNVNWNRNKVYGVL